ncbi:MAG: hypothetical protein J7577_23140 [Sphingobacteriaceae bacterium]|nr:hypothetical protein [Sphingobacteriaceae bacterium]
MNIYLLSLLNHSIGDAMVRFSQLPVKSSLLSSNHLEKLAKLTKQILDSYMIFFKRVSIASDDYHYNDQKIVKQFDFLTLEEKSLDELERKLLEIVSLKAEIQIIPVNIHLKEFEQLKLFSGFGILDGANHLITFYIYELTIAESSIKYTPNRLRYLDELLNSYQLSEEKSLRILASNFAINYNQFQKDCKEYFGDTFYQFINKTKMLGALVDQLFTNYSFKEIAARNGFSVYNNMHFLFRKKYRLPLELFPRLLSEI